MKRYIHNYYNVKIFFQMTGGIAMVKLRTINKKQLAARVLCALLLGTYLTGAYSQPVARGASAASASVNTTGTDDAASAWGFRTTANGSGATAWGGYNRQRPAAIILRRLVITQRPAAHIPRRLGIVQRPAVHYPRRLVLKQRPAAIFPRHLVIPLRQRLKTLWRP